MQKKAVFVVLSLLGGAWCGLGAACPARAADDALAAFRQLLDDAWEFELAEDPLQATAVGDHRFDDRLPAVAPADHGRRATRQREFLDRLQALDRNRLSAGDRTNYDMFRRSLTDGLAEYEYQAHLVPITNRSGFHVSFPELAEHVPLATTDDYERYLARLRAFGRYVDDHIALMRAGMKAGLTLPAIVLRDYRKPIEAHVVDDPTASLLYAPLKRLPKSFSAAEQARLAAAGREAVQTSVVPGYRKFLAFMTDEYVPAARGSVGAVALPKGREFYQHRVRMFTTLDVSPDEVHATGLAEVRRIRGEMQGTIEQLKFDGDLAAFVQHLRTDARFYATSPEQLMEKTAFVLKHIDGKLPSLFRVLPRTPYGIREVPAYIAPGTTTAYYQTPAGDGSRAGFYFVNTYDLKSRPLYEIEALSLHEAVPGHHLQLALQQELTDLPLFRRFGGYTAFVEGWALYAERLGLECGFYEDPYSNFGRLSYEMWRACRLVVDTGLHHLGWTREQAIAFMVENTALSRHNIEAEVDRYIAWPGQALAYKMGELHIRALRRKAEERLGDRFDVRAFHEVVLRGGSVPLDVLTAHVDAWLDELDGR